MTRLEKLLSISSDPIISRPPAEEERAALPDGRTGTELFDMLVLNNGYVAFESALHVFPLGEKEGAIGLAEWNSPDLWRNEYEDFTDGLFFFAEDIFGGQFCIRGDEILSFEPETGRVEHFSSSLEEWAARILEDYELITGYHLAHEWQTVHGRIPDNHRLIPLRFFIFGGEYKLENLKLVDVVSGMHIRGHLALVTRDIPDGSTIEINIVD